MAEPGIHVRGDSDRESGELWCCGVEIFPSSFSTNVNIGVGSKSVNFVVRSEARIEVAFSDGLYWLNVDIDIDVSIRSKLEADGA